MRVDVVDVGDGACTVIRDADETMVMDCGSWRSPLGEIPATFLRATIGDLAAVPSTVVITHFDLDHWMGLKAFADASAVGTQDVEMIYPRFPGSAGRSLTTHLAYQLLRLSAPERSATDLRRSWERVTRRLTTKPARAGDKFGAAGATWNVLWPPADIPATVSRKFDRIAKESEALAREYEPLERVLDRVYEMGFWRPDERAEYDVNTEYDPSDETESDMDDPSVDVYEHDEIYGLNDFADAPAALRNRLRTNRREVQSINNELSLVIEDAHSRILNLGDVHGWGLNELLRRGSLRGCYDTILAPHHGTQAPGERTRGMFPWARRIVAQNGHEHHGRMKSQFLGAKSWEVVSTAETGTVSFRPRCHCPAHGHYSHR